MITNVTSAMTMVVIAFVLGVCAAFQFGATARDDTLRIVSTVSQKLHCAPPNSAGVHWCGSKAKDDFPFISTEENGKTIYGRIYAIDRTGPSGVVWGANEVSRNVFAHLKDCLVADNAHCQYVTYDNRAWPYYYQAYRQALATH